MTHVTWRNELTVETNPNRSLCLAAWLAGRPWYAPTREDWMAAAIVEQFIIRPRVRKEARKSKLVARWG